MAQIKDNDNSDLLILSDDDTSFDTLVLDNSTNNVVPSATDSELITFDDDINLDFGTTSKVEQTVENEPFELDLSGFDSEKVEEKQPEVKTELKNDMSFDLSSDSIITQEVVKSDNEAKSNLNLNAIDLINEEHVGTMVDILDNAIHEMTTRSDVITTEVEDEEKHISDLKGKIADLESQVKVSEKSVSDLTDEKTMISKNIKSLEKMKLIEHAAQKEVKTK